MPMLTYSSVSLWAYTWGVVNRNLWLYCIELLRGVSQSVHATHCACGDLFSSFTCFKLADANIESKLGILTNKRRGTSRLLFAHLFCRNNWGFSGDTHWVQMSSESESYAWKWVSVVSSFLFLGKWEQFKSFLKKIFKHDSLAWW